MKRLVVLTACLITSVAADAAPQKRRPASRPAPTAFDRRAYAASVEGVDCSNILARYQAIVPFERAARSIAARGEGSVPPKDGFETTHVYQERVRSVWQAWLGGTNKVVLAMPLGEWQLKYDADRSVMLINALTSGITITGSPQARPLATSWLRCSAIGEARPVTWRGAPMVLPLRSINPRLCAGHSCSPLRGRWNAT